MAWLSDRNSLDDAGRVPLPGGPFGNFAHLLVFAALATFAAAALDREGRPAGLGTAAGKAAWTLAALYGLSDEIHQHFSPGRTCSVYDVVLDALGAAAALAAPASWRGLEGAPGRAKGPRPFLLLLLTGGLLALVTSFARPWPDRALSEALAARFGPP